MSEVTPGMKNVMAKLPSSGYTCPSCGLKVPSYQGRYPKSCPECGTPLSFADVEEMSRAQEILQSLQEVLVNERALTSPADVKRLIKVAKEQGKVAYKGQEYNVSSVSPSRKFIKTMTKGKTFDIEIDKLKSYELDLEYGLVILK